MMVECHHSRLLWFKFGLPRAAGTQHFSEALEDAMELNAMSLRPLIRKVSVRMGRRIEFQKWTYFQASSSYGNDACKLYLGNPMRRKRSLSQSFQIAPTTCMQLGTVTRKSVLSKSGPPDQFQPKMVPFCQNWSQQDQIWQLKSVQGTTFGS